MNTRTILVCAASVLAALAAVVELRRYSERAVARPGVPSSDGGGPPAADALRTSSPQPFALLELGVDTTPTPWVPYAFRLQIRGPGGASKDAVAGPSENGVTLIGPLAPGAHVRVTVVVGGASRGFAGEGEVVGEAETTIDARGGRQFLVVPVRPAGGVDWTGLLRVLDADGWPVAGAIVTSTTEVARTNAWGMCVPTPSSEDSPIEIEPPPDRPDLAAVRVTMSGLRGEPTVQLRSAYSSDAIIPELAADYRPGEAPEVTLRTVGPRSWVRRWSTDAKGTLAAVPCGEYAVSWKSAGSLRTGTLKVGHERSRFELQSAAAPSSKVEVTGIPDPADSDPGDFLVLIDRSDAAAFLPDTVRDSLAFAPMAGCGVTNLFELPDKPAGDGILRFSCVSPGRYEVRTFRRPRVLSRCVVVPDGVNGTVRVSADFEPQEGRIRGRLRGSDQGKEWIVEARIRGEFSRSQRLRPGGSYEVSGLAPGLYSVWVHREDWGREARRGQPLPESPWKNVVVDGRNTVTLDFDIE